MLGVNLIEAKRCADRPICGTIRKCELSNWSVWSACTAECDGMQRRFRTVTQYANTPDGLCIDEDLEQIRRCNGAGAEECETKR